MFNEILFADFQYDDYKMVEDVFLYTVTKSSSLNSW